MNDRIIDRRHLDFVLHELLAVESLTAAPRFAEHSRETFSAALDAAWQIASERYLPHRRLVDVEEPRFDGERVQLPPQTGAALRTFADAGFLAATFDEADGGMQLPRCVANACWALFKGANIAIDTYSTLSIGVANMLRAYGTPAQKQRWLPPLLAGRVFGTMVLTEPQAGSSLAEIRSTATPRPDGRYAIKGQKVFITAGDHELGENILHLVLARLPGAPAGVKGLSLFIVPKHRDGVRNDVSLAGLIHKLGCRGTTSAMLSFGERDDCLGELLGAPNQGLACMFRMMNEARINVGLSSAMLASAGYLHALDYARERVQGRTAHDPAAAPVPIVAHADVRRMLLSQKCIAEGGLALCLYGAMLDDRHEVAASAAERDEALALLDLLTPVIKAWNAHHGTEANSLAVQVHGGYGYTREYAVEQLLRDNRLNSIHEGTDGIQALDLLGRKAGAAGGAGMRALAGELAQAVAAARALGDTTLAQHAAALEQAWNELSETTQVLLAALPAQPRVALANASLYLDAFGHTVVAWIWLKQATLAWPKRGAADGAFYRGKLAAAQHFFRHELPRTRAPLELLRSLDASLVELDEQSL